MRYFPKLRLELEVMGARPFGIHALPGISLLYDSLRVKSKHLITLGGLGA